MSILIIFSVAIAAAAVVLLLPRPASAHCDTMDGPTAKDGLRALESGNLNFALKWIEPAGEQELRRVFEQSLKVRRLGPEAKDSADRHFLETLVRIHRAGEGAPYLGLKPAGVPIDAKVAAADKSLDEGTLAPLAALVPEERLPELQRRFAQALALKNFDIDDVAAARSYVHAYVRFFKFAEGEQHEHAHSHS